MCGASGVRSWCCLAEGGAGEGNETLILLRVCWSADRIGAEVLGRCEEVLGVVRVCGGEAVLIPTGRERVECLGSESGVRQVLRRWGKEVGECWGDTRNYEVLGS